MAASEPLLVVREAGVTDAEAIADLALELSYQIDASDVRHGQAGLATGHVVFVATTSERVIGWLHGFQSTSLLHGDRVEVAGLTIASDHQGHGVGTALVARLEQWAVGRGVAAVRVLSGSERSAAHRFYLARGYRNLKSEQVFIKSLRIE
ncbi:GNAT family N-acetyltransferase [Dactylosporangium sp. NPDC000521]|uniref:GNAT family N-acetyltransferase n=1 Tax=Dactylosporangium sp. NPDC000521 TaxID=3363975 RepID=UPI00369E486B